MTICEGNNQRRKFMSEKKGLFWGWYVVLGSFLILSINYGARYCFGVFVKPLADEYGWSRSVISLAASINMFVYSACAIAVGRIMDRLAPRWIVTIGALTLSASFLLTSFVKTPLQFYIVYGLLAGIGASGLGVVVTNSSVGKWFIRKRGLALGISTMGISFGTILLTPTAGFIVKNYNWQTGFVFLGILVFLIGVTLSNLFMRRTRPEAHGLLPDGETRAERVLKIESLPPPPHMPYREMFGDLRFWTLGVGFGLAVMTLMAVFVHQVAYALDNGIDKIAAASSLGAVGMAGFAGQFFFGWFSDRLRDAKYSAVIGMLIMAAGMVVLLNVTSVRSLYVFALIYGFGYGCLAPMMPVLTADRFGRHVMGSVYGMLTFFIGLGGSIGPIVGGVIYDRFGSYTYVWQANIVTLIIVALMLLSLKPGKPSLLR
jgi:MFS family permease